MSVWELHDWGTFSDLLRKLRSLVLGLRKLCLQMLPGRGLPGEDARRLRSTV